MFDTGVDPASRDTYEVVWMYMRPMSLFQNITASLQELAPGLNYNLTEYCANSDIDAIIQNIEIYASQGADGFLIVVDPTASARIISVLDGTGVPYVCMINSVRDENGAATAPCVGLESYPAGYETVQWLYDNRSTYWGDVDASKIGILDYNFSANTDFNDRFEGAKACYFDNGGTEDKFFAADGVSGALDEQTGYDLAAAIFAAHPEVEYWFVGACLEQYAQGATRAAEALNMTDRVLVTAVGSDILPVEWDNGYDGCWVSCMALYNLQYAIPGIYGLVSLMDGTSTPETLWQHVRRDTDIYTFHNVSYTIMTKDNYVEYTESIKALAGL